METTDALITDYVASFSVLDLIQRTRDTSECARKKFGSEKKKLVVSMEIQMNALKALQN